MAHNKDADSIDIMALLKEVHGSSLEDLRDERISNAVNTLEATHRHAARALRHLNTEGMRRPREAAALPAPTTIPEAAMPQQPHPHSKSNVDAQARGELSEPTVAQALPHLEVQSGEGAQVDLGHRTLTHIVRPNRGRK